MSKLPSKKKLNNSKQSSFKDSARMLDTLHEDPKEELKNSNERSHEDYDNFFYNNKGAPLKENYSGQEEIFC